MPRVDEIVKKLLKLRCDSALVVPPLQDVQRVALRPHVVKRQTDFRFSPCSMVLITQ